MIQIETPQQIADAEEKDFLEFQDAQERQNRPVITGLGAYVRECWNAAKEAKADVERRLINALRQKKGVYDSQKLAAIQKQTGSDIFMMLTDEKCAAAIAWLTDILFPSNDKPWGTKPTPVPDLSPEQMTGIQQRLAQEMQMELRQELIIQIQAGVITNENQASQWLQGAMQSRAATMAEDLRHEMQQAAKEARLKVEVKLEDVVEEAGWEDAVQDAIDDIVTFPAGVIKGPVLRKRKKIRWKENYQAQGQGQGQGQGYPVLQGPPVEVRNEVVIEFNRVSPFDIYPFPNAKTPQDGIIERHQLTRADLQALIGVEGYDDEAIQLVLRDYSTCGNWLAVAHDQTRQALEDRPNEWRTPSANKKIDALQMWASVQGIMLLENGMPPERVPNPLAEYAVEVWLINNYVIKCEVNGDPLGRVPYHFASFRRRNGSIWGAGVPELIKDTQDACNASARALINNMGIASGPQATVDVSQMPEGQKMTSMYPWKIWPIDGSKSLAGGTGRPPISFFVPPSMAAELMKVYEFFSNEADTKTGVPKYSYGNNKGSGGALSTASGFSMMMNNVSRGIKNVVRNIDKGIIKPSIRMTHEWELLYSNDPEYYVGDIKLIARGSSALIAKEQAAVRRNEFLQVAINPAVLQIIGAEGLAEILREIVNGMDFSSNEIVPTKEAFQKRLQAEQMQQARLPADPGQGREVDGAGAVQGGIDAKVV